MTGKQQNCRSDCESKKAPYGTIFLLRHGAVESAVVSLGESKRYIGWQDQALSDAGLTQARAWADYFIGAGLHQICCSDLSRCLETARIIGARCSLEPRVMPVFREVCLGAWEGQNFEAIKADAPQAFAQRGEQIADHQPPGGESFRDLQLRAWPAFEALVDQLQDRSILIVTHAGVIRVLLCRMLGMPLENLFSIGQAYAALNIIKVRPEGFRILALNKSCGC